MGKTPVYFRALMAGAGLLLSGTNVFAQSPIKPGDCPPGCNCGETTNCFWASLDHGTGRVTVNKTITAGDLEALVADLQKLRSVSISGSPRN